MRKIDSFLSALKKIKEENPTIENEIVFHQYSEIQEPDLKKIQEYGLEKLFIVHNKVSYDKSVKIMKEADVLVLFDTLMPNDKVQPYLPSKIVEYLLLKKPILGICDSNSPSYRILKEYGFKTIGSNEESIIKNIKLIINNKFNIEYSIDSLNINEYKMIK